jgi:cytochrome P450
MGTLSPSPPSRERRVPLAPGALPLVGHGFEYMRDPLAVLQHVAAWGPAVRFQLGPLKPILLREPVDIERLVVGEHKRLTKDAMTMKLRRVLGDGLLTTDGETWVRHRRLISPVFQPSSVAGLGRIMVDLTERHMQRIPHETQRELHADMTQLTLDIVTNALFASDIGPEAAKVGPAIHVLQEYYGSGVISLFEWVERLPLAANKRAHAALASLDEVLLGIIRRARERSTGGSDLLSMLLAARDDAGTGLGDRELRDHVMTFFTAGHETTALALTFTLFLLGKNPEVESRLRAEIANVLGERLPTPADMSRLPYARAIILETMRLYPPAWAIGREALEDITVAGYRVPKGEQFWMSQWVNHRDSRYFPEPEQFRPERWLDGLERTLPRFAYYPFGGGPRICIGNHFALMEAILALVTLLRRHRIRLVNPNASIELFPSITLRPKHPIPVVYENLLQ